MTENYCNRQWLNKHGSPSTGSIVAFDGMVKWMDDSQPSRETWIEISDCHCKVKIHMSCEDSSQEFINKIEKMRSVIDDFIDHLKSLEV